MRRRCQCVYVVDSAGPSSDLWTCVPSARQDSETPQVDSTPQTSLRRRQLDRRLPPARSRSTDRPALGPAGNAATTAATVFDRWHRHRHRPIAAVNAAEEVVPHSSDDPIPDRTRSCSAMRAYSSFLCMRPRAAGTGRLPRDLLEVGAVLRRGQEDMITASPELAMPGRRVSVAVTLDATASRSTPSRLAQCARHRRRAPGRSSAETQSVDRYPGSWPSACGDADDAAMPSPRAAVRHGLVRTGFASAARHPASAGRPPGRTPRRSRSATAATWATVARPSSRTSRARR